MKSVLVTLLLGLLVVVDAANNTEDKHTYNDPRTNRIVYFDVKFRFSSVVDDRKTLYVFVLKNVY
ncbi:AGAP006588-PB [Anopheles gambiae str. PEST]|uniref:AGAP006588-PB n=1 Tax=Anopheles gambiae TaxID=7165 RepID=A0A1U7F4M0_ANOGA|nr:putative secreted peptide [Anopheles gambiae]EDO63926.1 AGAP006588-PB [Anopheles gambiae str. PEST]